MKKQRHSYKIKIILIGAICMLGNQVGIAADTLPTVSTQAVTSIGTTIATGNGSISDLGSPDPEQFGICWNTIGSPTIEDNKTEEGSASATGTFTSTLTGLTPYTTYYVRAYATNSAGTSYGNEVSFSTNASLTTVTTQAVSGIRATTATGNGTITAMGVPDPTQHGICWNTTGSPIRSDNYTEEGPVSVTGAFTSELTGLNPGTTYYARAYVVNAAGTTYGTVMSFTTSAAVPVTVLTQSVTNIGATTASGNGNIIDLGDPDPVQHGICWNTSGSPSIADSKTEEGATSSTGAYTSEMSGLSPNTSYYVRAYATNLAGTTYGSQVSFTTAPSPATVTTQAVTGIGTTIATGNGNITDLGGPNPGQHGMCWNTTGSPDIEDNKTEEGSASATGTFTSTLTGLTPYTTYYVRAYTTNSAGTSYGNEVSFSTNASLTTVTTQAVSGIKATTATGNGTITAMGVPDPTQHGICWNTTGSPTRSDTYTEEGPVSATGAFTSELTGLNPGTTYYARAYVVNAAGTTYGVVMNFTTTPAVPVSVTTQDVTEIGTATATGNGKITDLGDPAPEQHGMCWNTTGSPTIADSKTEEGATASIGAYTSEISGLSPNTTYYVRAYATNLAGTTYGTETSFTSNELVLPLIAFKDSNSEGSESVISSNLQVELSSVFSEDVTVDYTVSGSATGGGTDYTLSDGSLTISAGETIRYISILGIVDDEINEEDETIIVTLSNPVNADLGTNTVHTYTITDNDAGTSLVNTSSEGIKVFPNPSAHHISIYGCKEKVSLIITGLSGLTVLKTSYNQGEELDISHLADGIYLISLKSQEGTEIVLKLVKQ